MAGSCTLHGQTLVDLEQALAPLLASLAKGSGIIARWIITREPVLIQLLVMFSGLTIYLDISRQYFLASSDVLDCMHCFSPNGIVPAVIEVGQA